jgi:STAS-like domain of unknown function (DUF4325)
MTQIIVAEQFSRRPVGRYLSDGNSSGEAFRLGHLLPALAEDAPVVVILDGVAGYPSSFLEEAFGGLVRDHGYTPSDLRSRLRLVANDPAFETYKDEIWEYIDDVRHNNDNNNSRRQVA